MKINSDLNSKKLNDEVQDCIERAYCRLLVENSSNVDLQQINSKSNLAIRSFSSNEFDQRPETEDVSNSDSSLIICNELELDHWPETEDVSNSDSSLIICDGPETDHFSSDHCYSPFLSCDESEFDEQSETEDDNNSDSSSIRSHVEPDIDDLSETDDDSDSSTSSSSPIKSRYEPEIDHLSERDGKSYSDYCYPSAYFALPIRSGFNDWPERENRNSSSSSNNYLPNFDLEVKVSNLWKVVDLSTTSTQGRRPEYEVEEQKEPLDLSMPKVGNQHMSSSTHEQVDFQSTSIYQPNHFIPKSTHEQVNFQSTSTSNQNQFQSTSKYHCESRPKCHQTHF
jgi:hypothetical protein